MFLFTISETHRARPSLPTVFGSALALAAILMLLVSWTIGPLSALANEAAAPNEIEEVIVYGEKSVLKLKRALVRAEDNVFSVFNSLNPDWQYDIRCYREVPVGSHIPRRVCYPNYLKVLISDAAAVWRGSNRTLKGGPPPTVSETRKRKKEKNLREIMEALKSEHPELVEALATYNEAKHRYVTASEKK